MILFRCHAGPEIGFGHLARCRALVAALASRGARCGMVGPALDYRTKADRALFRLWEPVPGWESAAADAASFARLAAAEGAGLAVLDDYRVDEAYQLVLREAGLRWLQFEGRTDRPVWADIVLNGNPAARPEDYAPVLRNKAARLLLGPSHAILRPEFSGLAPRETRAEIRNILVAFGAGGDRGAIRFTLETLLPAMDKAIRFTVVSGKHNPANGELAAFVAAHGEGRVNLLIDPPGMAEIICVADIAVTSGGTLTYELAACGVPMIVVAISDDQMRSRAWADAGVGFFLGRHPGLRGDVLVSAVRGLSEDFEQRRRLSAAASKSTDGRGAERAADALLALNQKVHHA